MRCHTSRDLDPPSDWGAWSSGCWRQGGGGVIGSGGGSTRPGVGPLSILLLFLLLTDLVELLALLLPSAIRGDVRRLVRRRRRRRCRGRVRGGVDQRRIAAKQVVKPESM